MQAYLTRQYREERGKAFAQRTSVLKIDDFTVRARHGSPPDDTGFVAGLDHNI